MIDFIKRIDIMGREFKFNIKGGVFNTVFGGILTILQAIGFLALLWYYGQDIYARREPNLTARNYIKNEYPKVNLNSKIFNFAIRVEDYYGKTIVDPSAFYFIFEWWDYTYDYKADSLVENETAIIREMVDDCSLKHFDNQTLQSYKLYKNKCTEHNYTIGGSYSGDFLKAPSLYVRKCDDYAQKKYNVTCKTKDEISKAYGKIYTSFFYQRNIIDPADYIDPLKASYLYHYNGIDLNSVNSVHNVINYSTAELTTDTGFLFSDTSTISFLEFETRSTDIEVGKENYHAIDIYVSRSFRAYLRTYVRISDALANVGGIMSFFTLFIDTLFSYLYLDVAYQDFLQKVFLKLNREIREDEAVQIKVELKLKNNNVGHEKDKSLSISKDSCFQGDQTENTNIRAKLRKRTCEKDKSLSISKDSCFQGDQTENTNNRAKLKKKPNLVNMRRKSCFNLSNMRQNHETVPNKQIDKLIDFKNINIEPVEISSGEFCYFYFCCYKNDKSNSIENVKFKLFQASKHEIDKQIEIVDLIRMKNQFKLVQKILLNENQSFMLQKRELHRVIDTKIMTCEDENILNKDLEKLNIQNLINYLRLRKMENGITGTDKLLYGYLDKETKEKLINVDI